jgi:biopolymer transport protein ExbB
MRPFAIAVLVAALSGLPAAAATSGASGLSLDEAGASAQKDLDASLKELTALRETIRAEKLPLTRELSGLEEELANLRRESERSSHDTDAGNLELAGLRGEVKLRQDEITYLGTLLDEYRANFETRINVIELQRYAPVIEAAKNAPTNGNMTTAEKFRQQLALVKTSIARLEDVVGGSRFSGQAIGPEGEVADGKFALIGPVALFASTNGKTAGLALAQTGSTKPAVRPIEAGFAPGILEIVNLGKGLLPVDPSRGGALKELVQKTNLFRIFSKGGPIMWPLLLASVLALSTVIERLIFLVTERKRRDGHALQQMLDSLEIGDVPGALAIGRKTRDFVCRALTYALEHRRSRSRTRCCSPSRSKSSASRGGSRSSTR